jgi:hypothetical protein
MKKLLLYLFLITSCIAYSQRNVETAKMQMEKGKRLLQEDPCNSSGLIWIKAALKNDSYYKDEVNRFINNCDKISLEEIKFILSENNNSYQALPILKDLINKNPNSEELNYLMAKMYFLHNNFGEVPKHIDIAINSDPGNLEYRWIRGKSLALGTSLFKDLKKSVRDLKFLMEKSGKTAKSLFLISIAQYKIAKNFQLASFHNDHNKLNFTDNYDSTKAKKKESLQNAVKYYEYSKTAYNDYKVISNYKNVEYQVTNSDIGMSSYDPENIDRNIEEINKKISEL